MHVVHPINLRARVFLADQHQASMPDSLFRRTLWLRPDYSIDHGYSSREKEAVYPDFVFPKKVRRNTLARGVFMQVCILADAAHRRRAVSVLRSPRANEVLLRLQGTPISLCC